MVVIDQSDCRQEAPLSPDVPAVRSKTVRFDRAAGRRIRPELLMRHIPVILRKAPQLLGNDRI
jgi:hypothetical protein